VALGTTTQEIANLVFLDNGKLDGNAGAKVLYSSLLPGDLLNTAGTNPKDATYADPAIAFEVLSKTSPIVTNGTQTGLLVTAGRAGTEANGRQLLLLQPESTTTRVIIDKPLVLSTGIVATTGTVNGVSLAKGMVSIENTLTLTTGSIRFGSGIEATLTQTGSLNATALDNSGLLIVDVSANKTVEIPVRGSGSVRKAGVGTATLTAINSYTGSTTLAAGVLELANASALGTSGSVQFAGGTLRYGSGVANDLSPRIAAIASGTTAGIDTGGNNVTFATGLSGAGGIAKLGAGTLVLTGSNSFIGAASVKAGTLQVGAGATTGSLAAAAAVDSGAFLRFLRGNDLSYSGALSGTGTVEQAGTGVLKLDGSNAGFAGTLVLSSGSVGLASDTASGTASIRFNGGTLRYDEGTVTDVSARIAELASGRSANIDTGVNLVSFASGLTGAGGLNKLGAGTLELQASNNFEGPTTVLSGLLRAGTALSSTSSIRVSGGSLEISSYRPGAELNVDANGTVTVPVDLGAFSFGTIVNQGRLSFTGGTAEITVSNLNGNGQAYFAADATLSGGISGGSITVAGDLVSPSISGGSVSAARLYQLDGGAVLTGVNVSGGKIVVQGQLTSELGTVSGGSLVFLAPVNVGSLDGGTLDAQASANLASVSRGTAKLSGSHVAIGTLTGGLVTLETTAVAPTIDVLSGGTLINDAALSVSSGTTSGPISGAGLLTKTGSLDLTLLGNTTYTGATRVMGGTLFVGGVASLSDSAELFVDDLAQARFTAQSGTITLKALNGVGRSFFASNAVILGGSISDGEVQAAGRLTANVSGGSVTAAVLTAGTVSGGTVSLTDGASSATLLTNGSINLASAASLAVSTGTFAGTLTGTGTLVKTGAGSLNLGATPSAQMTVSVQGGTLNVDALLTGTRSVAVAAGALLNTTTTTETFSGRLTGAGTTALTGAGTLTLGSTGYLQGRLTLGTGLNLDVSQYATTNVVDAATSVTLLGASQLTLGSRQVELQDLVLSENARLIAEGAVILYDSTPLVRLSDGSTAAIINQSNGIVAGSLVSGSLRFEENSKKGEIFGGGNYQFIAGRVKDLPTNTEVKRLLLDPIAGKTIRISSTIPNVTQEIVATGTGAAGFVTVGTLVSSPRFVIGPDILATFTEAGSLATNGMFVNNGSLKFSVLSGNKTVANSISGSGTLEKIDPGVLVLSGANTYSGATRLSDGVLQIDHGSALGTGTIVFNGGGLKYGPGISADLSKRFAAIGTGGSAAVDTGANNVTFASALSGGGGLSKSGTGTLSLLGGNTFTGPLEVSDGTVKVGIGTSGSLNASTANVSSGALLSFERNDAASFAGSLTGAGRVAQAGAGVLTLTGDGSAFTGTVELRNGTTVLGAEKVLAGGTVSFRGGTLRYGTGTFEDLSDQFAPLSTTALVDTGVYDVTYQTGLTGTAGFTKYGVGTLTFENKNEYAGTTTVAAGTLKYIGAGLASVGGISTLANTVVQLQNDDPAERAFSGLVSGAAQIQKTGTGTITISGTQTNSGGVTLNAGSLVLKNAATLGGTVTINSNGTLDLLAGSLNPNATLTFGGGKLRIGDSELIVNSLNLGSGEILFAGTAESTTVYYSQQTGEALASGTTATNGVIVPEEVTLLKYGKNADGSPAALSGALKGTITKLPATSDLTVTPSGKRLTFAVEGGLNLTSFTGENGVDLAITKPVNLAGDFKLKGGSLLLEQGGTLKSTGGSVVLGAVSGGTSTAVTGTIGAGGSIVARELTLTGKSALKLLDLEAVKGVQTLRVGALSTGASDSDRKADATLDLVGGTLVLVAGQTLVGSGSIKGNITLVENSVLSPGNSPGTLHIAGTLNLTNGIVRIEVGGLSSGTLVQDRISVSGGAVLIGGTLGQGPTFQIIDTDGVLSKGGTLGSLFVDGATNVNPTILNGGTYKFTFARQSSSGAVLPSVMYVLQSVGTPGGPMTPQIQRLRFASFAGSAPNTQGFASALDTRILTQQATTDGLLELGTGITSTADLPAQLAAAMPVVYAEMAALSTQRTLTIHQGLVGHFSSLRANLRDTPEGVFNAWTTGYGASNKQDGSRALGTAGFSSSTWGDLFGVEQRIGGFLLGITGAAGRTSANFANNPGSATTDSWHGGLYGVVDLESILVESGVLYGSTDTRARRTISAPGLTTREGRVTLNGSEWVANFGLSKPIAATSTLTLVPSLRLIAQGQTQDAAKETDLSGLEVSIAKQNSTTFMHQAGVELRRKLNVAGRPAAASLQLDWIHNYSAKGRTLDMALSGNPAASYGYRGSNAGADSFQVGAAFEAALTERTVLRLGGEYQSQTGLSTVRGSISLGYQF
jgi:fibronectin-binding autotransporter adhesin